MHYGHTLVIPKEHYPTLLELPDPCAFTVTKLTIEYRRPARVDDALDVRTIYRRLRGVRMVTTLVAPSGLGPGR